MSAPSSSARRGPGRPRSKAAADIHVRSFMGGSFAVCDVKEPSGQTRTWLLPLSILPASARPSAEKEVRFMHGDHVLYTQQQMPAAVRVPFWRLVAARKRGKARRT